MHDHSHDDSSKRIGWAFFLNFAFTIIEFIGGWLTNSTAIMADAVHDLGDCLSIGMAWVLNKLSGKQADERYTYGYRRFSLLSSLISGVVLVVGSIWVLSEAIPRLQNPEMPHVEGMIGLAIFGVLVNGYAAFKLSQGKTLNERILNWHLLEDVLGWFAVLIVSVVLLFIDLPILDPILSITFTLFILMNVIKNIINTVSLFLQTVPDSKIRNEIHEQLKVVKYISDVHHFHFWSLDGEHHVLTAHVVLEKFLNENEMADIKLEIKKLLSNYELEHTTIEFEYPDEHCRDDNN
jgi:cobalt-zinc-cadmium efflux system protein